ncbi:MAG: tRNA (adenosine(37)-N6)-threonylcarbamoyltransferase complex ATPase subunit type 1 TsaE [Candidatus Omnitrophica bacterium]|nr:tRNA (adenosine(37)-N6)-threonylcarbamoyltransferase complex ATPase subunit type 1 TsaE [Candidatus Omnitrophota bacterium]
MYTVITHSPEETIETAGVIGRSLGPGSFVALSGDLGAGKTVFAKGLAKGAGVAEYLYVNSPSFVILKQYKGKMDLYHFDLYRLEEKDFEETLDYRRYFYGDGIAAVEWCDRIPHLLPEEYLEVKIVSLGDNERKITLRGIGKRYEELVEHMGRGS